MGYVAQLMPIKRKLRSETPEPSRRRRDDAGNIPVAQLIHLKAAPDLTPKLNPCIFFLSSSTMRHPGESALLTDLHGITMLQAYFFRRMNDTAVFEFFARKLAAGLAQVAAYLAELRFTEDELQWLRDSGRFDRSFTASLEYFHFTGLPRSLRPCNVCRTIPSRYPNPWRILRGERMSASAVVPNSIACNWALMWTDHPPRTRNACPARPTS
jgi:hypothetical protein